MENFKSILHIVGNRPQFIKLSVLYKELSTLNSVNQEIIHTEQHSSLEMSGIFFKSLAIPEPAIHLEKKNIQTELFIAETSIALQQIFSARKNLIVIVYGDTNTTLSTAMAARRSNATLIHFEAGIRTGDNSMPEEINRIITDRLANVNYCCTEHNYKTMISEGYGNAIDSKVEQTGDLMYDAFLKINGVSKNITNEKNYIACTIHRANNILIKENLSEIINALNKLHKDIPVIMPLHPHTKKRIQEYGLKPTFFMVDPIGYPEMKTLLKNADYVITDSGGAAREAFFSQKKSVVVMEKPFWPEIIGASCAIKSKAETFSLIEAFNQLPSLNPDFQNPLFGNGDSAKMIKEDIELNML